MPVQKFRSLDEARRAQRSTPGGAEIARRMRFVLEFWSRLRPCRVPHGVFKFRSHDEAEKSFSLAPLSRR